jgi:hypothetical protein
VNPSLALGALWAVGPGSAILRKPRARARG